jgi:hypothetical protein
VFPLCLDVAVGQVGGHKRKYAAMLQSSSRAGVKVSMISLLLGALFSLWVVGALGLDFRGMVLMGRISARCDNRQFEVQRRSSPCENVAKKCTPLGTSGPEGPSLTPSSFLSVLIEILVGGQLRRLSVCCQCGDSMKTKVSFQEYSETNSLPCKGESSLAGTFVVKTRLWTRRYVERFRATFSGNETFWVFGGV